MSRAVSAGLAVRAAAAGTVGVAMDSVAVIDFETTGMSPEQGARATEIAVVLLRGTEVVDRYQSLMHSGAWVPPFIEELTGISNEMLEDAPPAERVMREVAEFVGGVPMVAHNASFDRRFWEAELARAGRAGGNPFACTLLLSRRLYPESPNHKLGTLARHLSLPVTGRAHRAMADAEMAAGLWLGIRQALAQRYRLPDPDHATLCALQSVPRAGLAAWIGRHCSGQVGAELS